MSKPLIEGKYRTMVDSDGFGTLEECQGEYFNGIDWSRVDSNAQFIKYWWGDKEEYGIISEMWESEMEKHYVQVGIESKNFGGV